MNTGKIKILHLEDRSTDVEHLHHVLKKGMLDFEAIVVDSRDEFTRMLKEFEPDLVISDHSMSSFNSLEALEIIKKADTRIPFILVTGAVSEEFAAMIIKSGADDYIRKDITQLLPTAVLNALEKNRLDKEFQKLLMERKIAEEALRELNESLESKVKERTAQLLEVNQELEAFSYSVSHDLRAPLRAVKGFSKILEEDYGNVLDIEGIRLLNIIHNSAKQMNTQIDDLLAFSKLGRQELSHANLDMTELVNTTLGEISQMTSHNAEIKIYELHPVHADSDLMKHVLMNLFSNAIKYSSNTPQPQVEVSSTIKNSEIVYSVKDNGVGFDMRYVDKIFGVFQRLHSSDEFEGTGVGLAIVQRIIHRHKGKVWAEGKVGNGATFYFSLPK